MPDFRKWAASERGAATTEKLLVVLFATVLVGGALMVFGPTLAAKYAFVGKMLGMEPEPMRTLADGTYERPGTNPIWYVLFSIGVTGFFAVFIAPLMFPRARRTRMEILVGAVERFPWLAPLLDPDSMADEKLRELRGLADEVNALHQHREGALEIQPHDFGKMALPSEQTVDASFSEMPNLDDIVERAQRASGPNAVAPRPKSRSSKPNKASLNLRNRPPADTSEDTQMAIPRPSPSSVLPAVKRGGDEIPFDAVDPAVKPQMKPLPPSPRRPPTGPLQSFRGDERTTTESDAEPRATGSLRRSVALADLDDDSQDQTIIRDSQPLDVVADPNERTGLVEPLDPRQVRSGPLASRRDLDITTPDTLDSTTQDGGIDSTTQDYETPE